MNTQHFNDQSHFHVKQHKNNKWRWRKRCWWWWCWNKEESDHWLNIENHHHHHEGDKWRRMWYGCKKQQENKSIVAVVQVVGGITITRQLHIVCNTFRFCSNYRAVRKFNSFCHATSYSIIWAGIFFSFPNVALFIYRDAYIFI